jgi:hypothetical protein
MNDLGITIKVYTYQKPRKEEKTWPASKYSIYNIGRQGVKFGRGGNHATCDELVA